MAAPKGNQFWKARAKHGRDKTFSSPEKLWVSCCEYFEWVEENPLWEEKLFAYQGEVTKDVLYKMRAMTVSGLCLFLDIDEKTWLNYKSKEEYKDFFRVITQVEKVIRNQKFTGAAADLLNPNIIARDLGLSDIQKKEHSGPDGRPIETININMTQDEATEIYQRLLDD